MGQYTPVKGNPGFVRDKASGAILNINSNEISQARKRKSAWIEEKEKNKLLSDKVDALTSDMNEIKFLLKQVLGVSNDNDR